MGNDLKTNEIHLYQFLNEKELQTFLQKVLQTDRMKLSETTFGNITMVMVNQNEKHNLKVFPWNQLLSEQSERCDLADVFVKLYKSEVKQLCHCEIAVTDSHTKLWTNELLGELPTMLQQLEVEQYYPVFTQTCCSDVSHKTCYLQVICLMNK